eukprot:3929075-Pyramimonas_sp.AAC.1
MASSPDATLSSPSFHGTMAASMVAMACWFICVLRCPRSAKRLSRSSSSEKADGCHRKHGEGENKHGEENDEEEEEGNQKGEEGE